MTVTPLPSPDLPAGRPRLVVTGFMGTGKTEAGGRAALLLGLPFLDLDSLVEAAAGAPVAAVFAAEGEGGFRAREREAVAESSRLSGLVVATGGGAPLDDGYGVLADGAVAAVLTCHEDELLGRLGGGAGRPLLGDDPPGRVRTLLRERADAYARAGASLDTTGLPPDAVAGRLAERYRVSAGAGPARVEVRGPDGPYPVLVGPGAIGSLGEVISEALPGCRRTVIVADGGAAHIAISVAAALAGAGFEVPEPLHVPAGEEAKTLEVLTGLWTRLRELEVERGNLVVGVGGGAALDVAGFAAATFARGLPLVNVPTTVLAMADAALGGKTAVDHDGVKNLAGVFHHPRAVVADTETLSTLDERTRRAGLGEVVKAAAIAAPAALDVLAAGPAGEALTAWGIEQAVRVKAAFVSEDPADTGVRRALNLGHTFAHAIESASGHRVPHGEAVAVGVVAAARLGRRLGLTPDGMEARLRGALASLGLPAAVADLPDAPQLGPDALRRAMEADKKRSGGRHRFVVPIERGVALVEADPAEAIAALLEEAPG